MSAREKIREVIFGVDTRSGRAFDVFLLLCILVSVLVAMLETVSGVRTRFESPLRLAGWAFTVLFSVEYLLRFYSAEGRLKYALSFFGVIDFLAVAPAYVALFTPVGGMLMMVRVLRLLRIFRVFGMASYVEETRVLLAALKASTRRIVVFLLFILTMVSMLGALMYVVERGNPKFDSIPRGVYWAIVTLTTVGYGDIKPESGLGQAVSAIIMILGYSLIVVPTGFVSVAVASAARTGEAEGTAQGGEPPQSGARTCGECAREGHDADARFCKSCGAELAAGGAED
jgi:voltage-gated potassium channel